MSVRFNVAELAGVVAKTLSSIDMRTASVLVDGKWQHVMTVIRFLCESTVEASANVEQTWGKHGPVHTDEFRIDSRTFWPTYVSTSGSRTCPKITRSRSNTLRC